MAEWHRRRAAAHLGVRAPERTPALPAGVRAQWRDPREAHEGAEEALAELRDVIRTMYPPILSNPDSDPGLAGAVVRGGGAFGARRIPV
ncbi:hypothetical protein [Streptomyces sp. PT12]|uniref:hypothetical protein n=1 Tax=Streptomyces sp. PT12 TaxID=1510197 RepID=UPI000DE54B6F|nr:hypothetical protein [Streptomyces sp. PT12]RBM20725.1 hypothetical protein DEH69_07095 [Streptomyces sp. PT12]